MTINRRRYMAKSSGKADNLVWVNFQMLKTISGYASIPIYKVGARNLTWGSLYTCRIGLSPVPNPQNPNTDANKKSRMYLSGDTNNKMAFLDGKGAQSTYDSGWKTYAEAGWELNQTIYRHDGTIETGVNIYHNNEADKLSRYDILEAGPVYLFFCQQNTRPSEFFALIDKQYIM